MDDDLYDEDDYDAYLDENFPEDEEEKINWEDEDAVQEYLDIHKLALQQKPSYFGVC